MIYSVINVCIAPERRREGIQQLKALAHWLTQKYGAETTLLGSDADTQNRKQLVTRYQSQEQMKEIDLQLTRDAEFDAWLSKSERMIVWDCSPGDYYRVVE
jgi:hypothetical protein